MYIDKLDENVTPTQIAEEYKWAVDTFPALHKYKKEHSIENLKKLCVELTEFCRSIYASTQSEAERKIFFAMLDKILKK